MDKVIYYSAWFAFPMGIALAKDSVAALFIVFGLQAIAYYVIKFLSEI